MAILFQITAENTVITKLTAGDGDDTSYDVTFAVSSEYFDIDANSGELTLSKELNYDVTSSITLQV